MSNCSDIINDNIKAKIKMYNPIRKTKENRCSIVIFKINAL